MSTWAFTQVERAPWPSGDETRIAVVRVRPPLFSRAFGLEFITTGDHQAAVIRLRSRRRLVLMRRVESPENSGTEIHADSADDSVAALREFLEAFDLSVEDLSWMRKDVRAGIPRPPAKPPRA